jgi:signal transduction histidine kinase
MLLGLAMVSVIGLIDLVTGPAFGFAFFYFIPIVPIAWTYGRWPGIVVATASAAMWFLADAVLSPDLVVAAIAWNASSRLLIFVGGAYLIDRVKHDRTRAALIDAQRDDFLRVLEHELTPPAERMIEGLDAAQARGSLDRSEIDALRHQAESLVFLTRDFVALGQAQAQRLQLRSVPVDIVHLVNEISRQRPDHRSVLVTVPGDGLIVTGDPDRLRQALANTVGEVFSDAGELDYVSVNVRARGTDALVTVSAATPASTTRLADSEHMRVSLRLARILVEAMGGSVTVERAALGTGTRVTIRVPLAAAKPGGAPLEASAARRVR